MFAGDYSSEDRMTKCTRIYHFSLQTQTFIERRRHETAMNPFTIYHFYCVLRHERAQNMSLHENT
jgi:hypothetical protein